MQLIGHRRGTESVRFSFFATFERRLLGCLRRKSVHRYTRETLRLTAGSERGRDGGREHVRHWFHYHAWMLRRGGELVDVRRCGLITGDRGSR